MYLELHFDFNNELNSVNNKEKLTTKFILLTDVFERTILQRDREADSLQHRLSVIGKFAKAVGIEPFYLVTALKRNLLIYTDNTKKLFTIQVDKSDKELCNTLRKLGKFLMKVYPDFDIHFKNNSIGIKDTFTESYMYKHHKVLNEIKIKGYSFFYRDSDFKGTYIQDISTYFQYTHSQIDFSHLEETLSNLFEEYSLYKVGYNIDINKNGYILRFSLRSKSWNPFTKEE